MYTLILKCLPLFCVSTDTSEYLEAWLFLLTLRCISFQGGQLMTVTLVNPVAFWLSSSSNVFVIFVYIARITFGTFFPCLLYYLMLRFPSTSVVTNSWIFSSAPLLNANISPNSKYPPLFHVTQPSLVTHSIEFVELLTVQSKCVIVLYTSLCSISIPNYPLISISIA